MPNTVDAGEADAIIEGENTHRVATAIRFDGTAGEDYRLTTNQQAAENGEGYLVEHGEIWTNYDPEGQTHYLGNPSGQSSVDVYVLYGGRFVDSGGVA